MTRKQTLWGDGDASGIGCPYPDQPGVYAIYAGTTLFYIGQTDNLKRRILEAHWPAITVAHIDGEPKALWFRNHFVKYGTASVDLSGQF